MPTRRIERHKTAINRTDYSRPIRLALEDGVITPSSSVFDYGCGKGTDITRLRSNGIQCNGWDPTYRPRAQRRNADVVNLGYVVNVIEDIEERERVLNEAWELTDSVLIVAARLTADVKGLSADNYEDGFLTRAGTFQKFFIQSELREWIDTTLAVKSVPAAPGVFYAFRRDENRQNLLATRYRRHSAMPQVRKSDVLFAEHQPLFDALMSFLTARGRLPAAEELPEYSKLIQITGSIKKAYRILQRVTDIEEWRRIRFERAQDLLVHLALTRFTGRPKFSQLPNDLKNDVKAFFGTYFQACKEADHLLFQAGNAQAIDAACRTSPIGKHTPNAIYVHRTALQHLPPVLRVYEGCARAYLGTVETANICKLNRHEPMVSYLSYPGFDTVPHPALVSAVVVPLKIQRIRFIKYGDRTNPPILHNKEKMIDKDYPHYSTFLRFSEQEQRHGLLFDTNLVGTKELWEARLREHGFALRGHRLIRTVVAPQ